MDLQQQLEDLKRDLDELTRRFNENTTELDSDVNGMFDIISAVPTHTPKNLYDQVKIYTNGTTYRLYWYDWVNHVWHYATST
jgi:hypothetical protein